MLILEVFLFGGLYANEAYNNSQSKRMQYQLGTLGWRMDNVHIVSYNQGVRHGFKTGGPKRQNY